MIMRILEPGNNNRVECNDCGSKLQFEASDINQQVLPRQGYDAEDPYTKYTIGCPSCTMAIEVTNKITPGIARIIAEREYYRDHNL
jgi:hypothetical protein